MLPCVELGLKSGELPRLFCGLTSLRCRGGTCRCIGEESEGREARGRGRQMDAAKVQLDWTEREFLEGLVANVKKITDFLNKFGKGDAVRSGARRGC